MADPRTAERLVPEHDVAGADESPQRSPSLQLPLSAQAPAPSRLRALVRSDALALVAVVVALAFLWGRGRTVWYWLDEGLSIGISSHRLKDIASLLREDGSPPLYYWILHGWIRLFGTSESATHLLSLVFALATVVAAWWMGRSLFGRRTGWFLVVLLAVSPFLASYANETRMYTLVVLLAMVATGSFLHAFVFGRRRYLLPFSAALALFLYTHNWAILFALGATVALVPCVLTAVDRRRVVLDALFSFGLAAIAYVPWVPTVLFQAGHTGAPWSPRPTLQLVREQMSDLVGGKEAVVALGLGAGVALAALLRRWRSDRQAVALAAASVIPVVAVGAGWLISRDSSVWALRYLGAILPALLLVLAVGLASGGQLALAALGVVVFLAAPIDVKTPPYVKSNVRAVTEAVAPLLSPGDVVISPDYGEVPVLAHYLPPGLRYATAEGLVADPLAADQRDASDRLRRVRLAATLQPLIDGLTPGGRVLLVCPPSAPPNPGDVQFILLIMQRCEDATQLLAGDGRLALERTFEPGTLAVENTPVRGSLFTRRG